MPFIKFPEITNTYHGKFLGKFQEEFGPILNTTYITHEKIHGANIQLVFEPNQEMQVASRNRILDKDEDFYGVHSVLKNIDLSKFQSWANSNKANINLYGEIFGSNIQNGVDYGPDRRILFFTIFINDVMKDIVTLDNIFSTFNLSHLRVPEVARFESWKDAIRMDTEFLSKLNPIEGNLCEGVVIQPLDKVIINNGGHYFILKKKNKKFMELMREGKTKNPSIPDEEVLNLRKEFESLINENRVQSIFSKHGEIQEIMKMGEYIKLVWQDAMNEFLIDYEEEFKVLDKSKQKMVTNVGAIIRNLLLEHL